MDFALNRSFKYGDGIFETLRLIDGKIIFLKEHFERLSKSFELLGLDKPQSFSPLWLESEINMATSAMDQHADSPFWRVRMTFWRNAPGLYYPENNSCSWHVEAIPLASEKFQLNRIGLNLGICRDVRLSSDLYSSLKSTSALPYVMAAIERKKMAWDDAFLLNSFGRIAESVSSNIFLLTGKELKSPPLSEGPVNGIIRRIIIENAKQLGLKFNETEIEINSLEHADEVWLSNSVKGLQWVGRINGVEKNFDKIFAEQFITLLNNIALQYK